MAKRKPPTTPEEEQAKDDAARDAALLQESRDNIRTGAEAWGPNHLSMEDDSRFGNGNQWDKSITGNRGIDERPMLTINRLPQFRNQIVNTARQNPQAILVSPMDGNSDPSTAEALQGLIRHTENVSVAKVAYATGIKHAVEVGLGWIKLSHEWVGDTFEQEIRIDEVPDWRAILIDPAFTKWHAGDARWGYEIMDVPKNTYKRLWGDRFPLEDITSWLRLNKSYMNDWLPEGKVRVVKWYRVVHEQKVKVRALVTMPEIAGVPSEGPQEIDIWEDAIGELEKLGATVEIRRRRKVTKKTVEWYIHTANQILERGECPGTRVPLYPVIGSQEFSDGKREFVGLYRFAKDPQRMYNVWVSAQTEMIATAPRSPFIVAFDQIQGFEELYRQANQRNFAFLPYHPKVMGDVLVPPPQRQSIEPPINAISVAIKQSDNDLKAVTGIYDAALGERGPQESGRALNARKLQGEIANFHYAANLALIQGEIGRSIIEWAPIIWDVPTIRRIVGLDNQPRLGVFHAGNGTAAKELAESWAQQHEDSHDADLEQAVLKVYDLSTGRFDVNVTSGDQFESQRQESAAMGEKMMQAYPNLVPIIADIVMEEMGTPGAIRMAKRLRKALPPNLKDDGTQESPDALKAQLGQMQGQLQMLAARNAELESEERARGMDNAVKIKLEAMRNENALAIAAMKDETGRALALLTAEYQRITSMVEQSQAMIAQMMKPAPKPPDSPAGGSGAPGGPAGQPA